ncbi:hypothetical protein SCHPADRAFT_943503 [Schizopora paradoxa]|uniref:F-box domain-containing protein n=1 Tax=Schizopora paradoxa TaxID=27342 RepID=A0A0H2RCY7_9AGAM|nr:hypothetical protein SCHPADRAFT_943503 [Schizopora paradoxa]
MSHSNKLRKTQISPEMLQMHIQDGTSKQQIAEDIKDIVLNYLEDQDGFELPTKLREEEVHLDSITYEGLLNRGIIRNEDGKGYALVSRARQISSRIVTLDGILDSITSRMKNKVKTARQRIDHVASVCGLASLPPEVLSLVFSFIIHGSPSTSKPRSLISVRLSHVCRQFRYIVTTNPRFWTTINTTPFTPELGLVNACLERSKDCPLDIQLNLYATPSQNHNIQQALLSPRHVGYDKTFLALRPHTHRWRSLHLNFIRAKKFKGISGFWRYLKDTIFPMLDSISAEGDECEYADFNAKLSETSSWKCPNLTGIILRSCVPNPLPNLAAVTTFDIEVSDLLNFADMLKTLNEMPSIAITNLRLDISKIYPQCSTDVGHRHVLEQHSLTIGTVKSFELGFAADHIADDVTHGFECVQSILAKLYLPNAEDIVLKGSDPTRPSKNSLPLDRLLLVISKRCPKVINCVINITRNPSIYTILPYHLPPNLETLRIACNTCLIIDRKSAEEEIYSTPSKIRRITLGVNSDPSLRTSGAVDWIDHLKERMEKYGGWDVFETLTLLKGVDKGGLRNIKTILVFELDKIIPREEVEEWCESTHVFPEIMEEYKRNQTYDDEYDSWG